MEGEGAGERYDMKSATATSQASVPTSHQAKWAWPIRVDAYDRSADLTQVEQQQLSSMLSCPGRLWRWTAALRQNLDRLIRPVSDVMGVTGADLETRRILLRVLLLETARRQKTFWAWTTDEWAETLCPTHTLFAKRHRKARSSLRNCRPHLFALGYLGRCIKDSRPLGRFHTLLLAQKVFGQERVNHSVQRVTQVLSSWGYGRHYVQGRVRSKLGEALLTARSPYLEDLTLKDLAALHGSYRSCPDVRHSLCTISRVLKALGIISEALKPGWFLGQGGKKSDITGGVAPEWLQFVQRWRETTTVQPSTRSQVYIRLLKAGRWITKVHPELASPALWTRETAAEYVATVLRLKVGEWTNSVHRHRAWGKPLSPRDKVGHLYSVKRFFLDCQEWEWIPRRFDPARCFAAPRSVKCLIAPDPRVIADDVWAKLLWAGLNVTESDLDRSGTNPPSRYPPALIRALSVVWLFAGLRGDEIRRLRVGCIRWHDSADDSSKPRKICLLDVPVNKTSTAFTKPVDRVVGEAIEAWERERPNQPAALDRKTAELVHYLFAYRSYHLSQRFINRTLIPALCRKAGVPRQDARGTITIHRARSTIASQLLNAKEPMSLFELQEWLGHRSPASTQHYAKIAPKRLAKSYSDAEYFARNVRTIQVLIDQDAIRTGTAAHEPWKFYDLGHGYCTYDFFEQCPHRMACAKCAFYRPKSTSQMQILEAKSNLLRLRQDIPLREEEVAAVDDGLAAMEKLLAQLADVPTPAGPTPRQLQAPRLVQLEVKPISSPKGGRDNDSALG